jgi:hypothetical protein
LDREEIRRKFDDDHAATDATFKDELASAECWSLFEQVLAAEHTDGSFATL